MMRMCRSGVLVDIPGGIDPASADWCGIGRSWHHRGFDLQDSVVAGSHEYTGAKGEARGCSHALRLSMRPPNPGLSGLIPLPTCFLPTCKLYLTYLHLLTYLSTCFLPTCNTKDFHGKKSLICLRRYKASKVLCMANQTSFKPCLMRQGKS